jgi:hypothetical protein
MSVNETPARKRKSAPPWAKSYHLTRPKTSKGFSQSGIPMVSKSRPSPPMASPRRCTLPTITVLVSRHTPSPDTSLTLPGTVADRLSLPWREARQNRVRSGSCSLLNFLLSTPLYAIVSLPRAKRRASASVPQIRAAERVSKSGFHYVTRPETASLTTPSGSNPRQGRLTHW